MTDERDARLLSGAYSLDALTPEEAAAVEAAMLESEELQHEVVGLVDTAVALGLSVPPVDPPASLRASILAGIEDLPQERPLNEALPALHDSTPPEWAAPRSASAAAAPAPAPEPTPASSKRHLVPRRRRRVRIAGVLLASLGAVALIFGGGVVVQSVVQQPQSQFSAVGSAPDVQRVTGRLVGGGTAEIAWSRHEQKTTVVVNGVRVPSGRVLQLWAIRGKSITSEGLYQPAGDADYVVLDGVPAAGETFAVSVEPSGGSRQPTTTPLTRVPLTA